MSLLCGYLQHYSLHFLQRSTHEASRRSVTYRMPTWIYFRDSSRFTRKKKRNEGDVSLICTVSSRRIRESEGTFSVSYAIHTYIFIYNLCRETNNCFTHDRSLFSYRVFTFIVTSFESLKRRKAYRSRWFYNGCSVRLTAATIVGLIYMCVYIYIFLATFCVQLTSFRPFARGILTIEVDITRTNIHLSRF